MNFWGAHPEKGAPFVASVQRQQRPFLTAAAAAHGRRSAVPCSSARTASGTTPAFSSSCSITAVAEVTKTHQFPLRGGSVPRRRQRGRGRVPRSPAGYADGADAAASRSAAPTTSAPGRKFRARAGDQRARRHTARSSLATLGRAAGRGSASPALVEDPSQRPHGLPIALERHVVARLAMSTLPTTALHARFPEAEVELAIRPRRSPRPNLTERCLKRRRRRCCQSRSRCFCR